MTKRYTSDLHLQHNNILKYDNRPFNSIEEHDEHIVEVINEYVNKDDQLYILWDICWKPNKWIETLKEIKCNNVFFIQGNHDFTKYLKIYENLWWTNLWLMHIDKEAKVVLCHYPMEEWFHSHHKEDGRFFHIHGHSHWNSIRRKWRIDVGLTFKDMWRPVTLEEIKEILINNENIDHGI